MVLQVSSLESKLKKQEEAYRAEKTTLEAGMAEKVGRNLTFVSNPPLINPQEVT